ncbi:MAG TPA: winged helix DNA-binding domain-containing protein [Candidatus Saccharimonadales bacterium]|nr:winged helix DNA-binding domain-containing protein [Candidatus Saccharimonadales bacterium]
MKTIDIPYQRLHNQNISNSPFTNPVDIVGWMGAVQSQDYSGAKWAIGLRSKNITDDDVEQAVNAGEILRTHVMRPTWHFVLPEDIRWMLELTAPRVHALSGYYYRKLGLTEEIFKKSNNTIVKALIGGKQLTRSELVAVLKGAKLPTEGLSHLFLIGYAELERVICNGPRKEKQFTYMLLDERVPHTKARKRDEALAELAKRYFTSHGPATLKDYVWWSGLSITDVKTGFEAVKKYFIHEIIDDKTYWFSPDTVVTKEKQAYLLPNYDEYIVGYTDRSAIFDPSHISKLDARANPLFQNTIVINGKIIGTWKRDIKKNKILMNTTLFRKTTNHEDNAIGWAIKRYEKFLGIPTSKSR